MLRSPPRKTERQIRREKRTNNQPTRTQPTEPRREGENRLETASTMAQGNITASTSSDINQGEGNVDHRGTHGEVLEQITDLRRRCANQSERIRELEAEKEERNQPRRDEPEPEFIQRMDTEEYPRDWDLEDRMETFRNDVTRQLQSILERLYHTEGEEQAPYHLQRQSPLREQRFHERPEESTGRRESYRRSRREEETESPARQYAIKPQLPTFEGKSHERPAKFLRELKMYKEITQVSHQETPFLLTQALKGWASEWWDLVAPDIRSWEDFENKFMTRFWSQAMQRQIRDNLYMGYYRADRNITRVAYATRLIGNARDLRPQPPEEEIIILIARHFTQQIDDTIHNQGIHTVEGLMAILERADRGTTVNQPQHSRTNYESNWRPRGEEKNTRTTYESNWQSRGDEKNTELKTTTRANDRSRTSFTKTAPNNHNSRNTETRRIRMTQIIPEWENDTDLPQPEEEGEEKISEN